MEIVKAPAKINLFLKIQGVRDDGYHLLDSLFAPINLFDEIKISENPAIKSDRVQYLDSTGNVLNFNQDTISKILKLLRETNRDLPSLEVNVTKNIPTGAGLGGGSSDAATILLWVQEKWGTNVTASQLPVIAEKTGADVPFFLRSTPAMVRGIGEFIEPIELEPLDLLVWKPPFEIPTKEAYGWFDAFCGLTRRYANVTSLNRSEVSGSRLSLSNIVELLQNDLEKPVEARHPEIAVMKTALRNWGALGALMSGSGSSVFGIFRSPNEVEKAREKLQQTFPANHVSFICKTI